MTQIWEQIESWCLSQGLSVATICLKSVIIAVVGYTIIRLVSKLLQKILAKTKMDKAAYGLIITLVKTLLFLLLGLMLASGMGIDVSGIVAMASVATLALSLALQNMLANIIGGFVLWYTDPFSAGDYVEIAGQYGTIVEIGMAYTKLITDDNKTISMPNNSVTSAKIVNYSVLGIRRLSFTCCVPYDAAPETVVSALLSAAADERVLPDKEPFAALDSYGERTANYVLQVWAKADDYLSLQYNIMKRLGEVFKEKGIDMAHPNLSIRTDK